MVALLDHNADVGRLDATLQDLGHLQLEAEVTELGDLMAESLLIHARVEECREGHVPADSGKAVEVSDSHDISAECGSVGVWECGSNRTLKLPHSHTPTLPYSIC